MLKTGLWTKALLWFNTIKHCILLLDPSSRIIKSHWITQAGSVDCSFSWVFHKDSKSSSAKLLSGRWPQPVLLKGAIPSCVGDISLPFAELHEVPDSSFLQSVEDPLMSSAVLQHISHSPAPSISCKFADDVLHQCAPSTHSLLSFRSLHSFGPSTGP